MSTLEQCQDAAESDGRHQEMYAWFAKTWPTNDGFMVHTSVI